MVHSVSPGCWHSSGNTRVLFVLLLHRCECWFGAGRQTSREAEGCLAQLASDQASRQAGRAAGSPVGSKQEARPPQGWRAASSATFPRCQHLWGTSPRWMSLPGAASPLCTEGCKPYPFPSPAGFGRWVLHTPRANAAQQAAFIWNKQMKCKRSEAACNYSL